MNPCYGAAFPSSGMFRKGVHEVPARFPSIARFTTRFARRHRCGERVSTKFVEFSVDPFAGIGSAGRQLPYLTGIGGPVQDPDRPVFDDCRSRPCSPLAQAQGLEAFQKDASSISRAGVPVRRGCDPAPTQASRIYGETVKPGVRNVGSTCETFSWVTPSSPSPSKATSA